MRKQADVFRELLRRREAGEPLALCTVVRTAGSTPRKSAARMLVGADGSTVGTIGGGRVEKEVTDAAQALLRRGEAAAPLTLRYHLTHSLAMCCGGEMEVFVEPILPNPVVVVCGGGHVGQALVPLLPALDFTPILAEDLPELGSPERFPDAARILDSFDVRDWQGVPLDRSCYVVIVTREHAQDQALLEQLVGRDLGYLGLIGSMRKVRVFRQRLLNKGFPVEQLDRVRAPIGLPIGAQTPSEIALAIAAELVSVRASRRSERAAAPERAPVTPPDEATEPGDLGP